MRNITSQIGKVKKYLTDNNIPFMKFKNTENYTVLRASGGYHYLILKFYDMPSGNWKGFEFKIESVSSLEESVKAIDKYLNL